MRRFIFGLFVLYSCVTFSQVVNIENRRVSDGTYGFSGALNLSFSAQKQKDPLYTFQFKPVIQYKFGDKSDIKYQKDAINDTLKLVKIKPDKNKHLLLLISDLQYTGSKGKTYANYGLMHLRYAYRIKESGWKWESYSQIQYNQLLLQKVRTIFGTGIRAKLLDVKAKPGGYENRAMRLFIGTSVFYEYEEIHYTHRPMEYLNAARWSSYISSYFNFKYVEVAFTSYIQPNLGVFKDFRVLGEYSVFFRISEPFSIRFSFNHFYDSKPPETVTPSTYSFSVGLTYKLDKFRIDPEKWAKRKQKWLDKIQEDKENIQQIENE
ncbi:MAG: DUF481 domain-containing protein [Crocinitomicaceae bacterium]|nr:DUF481 domain-containing protein [Crocinitomicaceae bacterium]